MPLPVFDHFTEHCYLKSSPKHQQNAKQNKIKRKRRKITLTQTTYNLVVSNIHQSRLIYNSITEMRKRAVKINCLST